MITIKTFVSSNISKSSVISFFVFVCLNAQLITKHPLSLIITPVALYIIAIATRNKTIKMMSLCSVSFSLYYLSSFYFDHLISSKGILIQITNRFVSLICFLTPFYISLISKKENLKYFSLGKADKQTIIIFSISCLMTFVSFTPFMKFDNVLLIYSVIFALINAPLEEIVWRGIILSVFSNSFKFIYSLLSVSLLFGLSHYFLGFSLQICLIFAFGGILFSFITHKTKGILCSTIIHFISNVCMGLTGMIF